MSTATARHIDTADAAKMIRQTLHRKFPATTFSVRIQRYSMGSSISVRWIDGPSKPLVEKHLNPYETKSFDGTDDSTHYGTAWLLESGEMLNLWDPALDAKADESPKVEEVYFSFYLQVDRDWSLQFARKLFAQVARYFGVAAPDLFSKGPAKRGHEGWELPRGFDGHKQICTSGPDSSWYEAVRKAANNRLLYAPPAT